MTDNLRAAEQIAFIAEIDKMKDILRMNVTINERRRENDAEHSWHMAMCAVLLREYSRSDEIDMLRVVKMCLVHDLVEIYAGDTFCYDAKGNKDKKAREIASADKLFAMLPSEQGGELRSLWEEFDAEETEEALYAAAVDRLQPFILNFNTSGHTWAIAGIKTDALLSRLEPVRRAMPALWPTVLDMIEDCVKKGMIEA